MAFIARTEADLADAVRGTNGPLRIVGGGTRTIATTGVAEVLETSGLSGVTLYEPGALTLVARAGTPLAEVAALLAKEGQRLPFEVPDMRGLLRRQGASTLGGVVASNASGPRRVHLGACRDHLLGVRFVDGTGNIVKNGGRVMKNVTGYDLVKLMAGSHGTLGVLTEVSFKVLPVPEIMMTLVLNGLSDVQAVAAMLKALSSPFEVSGAAHWPGIGTFLRLEGFKTSVNYRAGQLSSLLSGFGPMTRAEDDTDRWDAFRDAAPLHGRAGDIWRVSVKPSEAPMIVARSGAEAVGYDWGGGLIWMLTAPGTDLRANIAPFAGHATRVWATTPGDGIAAFQPSPPALEKLAAGLRAKFDPRGILNVGLM